MKVVHVLAVAALVIGTSGCRGSKPKTDTPEEAMRNMQQALVESQPARIFEALPASYQAEIDALVADAAKRMDAELWNEGTGILKRLVDLLKSKRDLLLASPMMENVPNKDDVARNWDTGVSLLQELVTSDFSRIDRLRQGNVAGLLSGDGAAIMARVTGLMENSESSAEAGEELAKLKAMTVSVVSTGEDTAVVKAEAPGEEPEMIDMVKVEGVWIPKDIAEGFEEGIAQARNNLSRIDFASEEGQRKKAMAMMQMGAIKPMLAQLEAAKTQEDLQAVFGGMMMMIMGGMNQGGK